MMGPNMQGKQGRNRKYLLICLPDIVCPAISLIICNDIHMYIFNIGKIR